DAVRAHERNSLSDPGTFRRRGQKSFAGGYAQARQRADKIRQAARVSPIRRCGARVRQHGIGELPAARRRAVVAQGDGIPEPAPGRGKIAKYALPRLDPPLRDSEMTSHLRGFELSSLKQFARVRR